MKNTASTKAERQWAQHKGARGTRCWQAGMGQGSGIQAQSSVVPEKYLCSVYLRKRWRRCHRNIMQHWSIFCSLNNQEKLKSTSGIFLFPAACTGTLSAPIHTLFPFQKLFLAGSARTQYFYLEAQWLETSPFTGRRKTDLSPFCHPSPTGKYIHPASRERCVRPMYLLGGRGEFPKKSHNESQRPQVKTLSHDIYHHVKRGREPCRWTGR